VLRDLEIIGARGGFWCFKLVKKDRIKFFDSFILCVLCVHLSNIHSTQKKIEKEKQQEKSTKPQSDFPSRAL
jgi:hypothetical protein